MEGAIILMSAFVLFLLFLGVKSLISEDYSAVWLDMVISILFTIAILVLALSLKSKPRAIDVYSNQTTLEVTYRDGVPIDSTVVWK